MAALPHGKLRVSYTGGASIITDIVVPYSYNIARVAIVSDTSKMLQNLLAFFRPLYIPRSSLTLIFEILILASSTAGAVTLDSGVHLSSPPGA